MSCGRCRCLFIVSLCVISYKHRWVFLFTFFSTCHKCLHIKGIIAFHISIWYDSRKEMFKYLSLPYVLYVCGNIHNLFVQCRCICFSVSNKKHGLLQIKLAEPVKLQVCKVLHHIVDIQTRHRVESIVAFSNSFVESCQQVGRKYEKELSRKDIFRHSEMK